MDALFEGLSSERFISYLTEKLCLFCKDKPIRAVSSYGRLEPINSKEVGVFELAVTVVEDCCV
jgi:hypothetical protein